jgi:hypothetical protein
MQRVFKIIFTISLFISQYSLAQENRAKIKEYINHEIMIEDNFSGQSITLIKEKNDYFILRKFFGSGVPVVCSCKYKVVFMSDYQISFSEIIETTDNRLNSINKEDFVLCIDNEGLVLLLNRLKVVIKKN